MKAILSDLVHRRLLGVVVVTAMIGILSGLLPLLPLGILRPDGFNGEIVYRSNDFESYGWHRAENAVAFIHPVYAAAIAANKTLPVLIATLGHIWTGSDALGRLIILLAYCAAYGVAVPLFVLTLTNSSTAAIVTALAMAALDWKELIYGYNNMPLSGRVATTLFVLELALVMFRKRNAAFALWAVHFVTHPTTAVALFFPFLAFAVLLDADRWPQLREKGWHFTVIAAAPLALAGTLFALEKAGILFPGTDGPSYWAVIRVGTMHTIFFDTERSFVFVLYAQLCLALAVLGWSSFGDPRLNLLNRIVSAYGLGMLIASLAFVETETSVSVAALLPMRYADVMYVVLIFNLVSIVFGQRTSDGGCRFAAAAVFTLLLIGHDANPLFGIGIWAVGQRFAERHVRWSRMALTLFAMGLSSVAMVAVLPTANDLHAAWYFRSWMEEPMAVALMSVLSDRLSVPAINSQYAVLFAHDILVVIAIAMAGRLLRRPALATAAMGFVVIFAIAPVASKIVNFPYRGAAVELPIAVGWMPNRNDPAAELMTWMQREIPNHDGVLGQPSLFLRLKLSAHVSMDDDLISLMPYAPATSAAVIDEYRELYGIDLFDVAKQGKRLSDVLDEAAWDRARQKVLAGELPEYQWVVEVTSQKPAAFPVRFENSRYRVYSTKKAPTS